MMKMAVVAAALVCAAPAIASNHNLSDIQDRNRYSRAQRSDGTYINGCNCLVTINPFRGNTLNLPKSLVYGVQEIVRLMGFTPSSRGSVTVSVATKTGHSAFMADKTRYFVEPGHHAELGEEWEVLYMRPRFDGLYPLTPRMSWHELGHVLGWAD
jgi:hypothetical protein